MYVLYACKDVLSSVILNPPPPPPRPTPPPHLHPKVREFPNTLRVAGQMQGISYHTFCSKVVPVAQRLVSVISEIVWEERLKVYQVIQTPRSPSICDLDCYCP